MIKHFYSYLIEQETIEIELENLDLSKEEKKHLVSIAESSIHYTVIDTILSELPEKEKKKFLENIKSKNHEKIWKHLFEKTEGIEAKIIKAANGLLKDLLKDVSEAKGTSR